MQPIHLAYNFGKTGSPILNLKLTNMLFKMYDNHKKTIQSFHKNRSTRYTRTQSVD